MSSAFPAIAKCKRGQFRCDMGRCINKTQKCDGKSDCPDESDETRCCESFCVCAKNVVTSIFSLSSHWCHIERQHGLTGSHLLVVQKTAVYI